MNPKGIVSILTDKTRLGRWAYHLYSRWKGRERHLSLGTDNPDKTFYVIGFEDVSGGLFWLVNKVVMHIAYAIDHHYIPVVDFKNHLTQYTNPNDLHKSNLWEDFFEQPAGYTLEDIRHSQNIIISSQQPSPQPEYLMGQEEFYNSPERIKFFHGIFHQYIRINPTAKAHLETIREQYFPQGARILGVLCRGTDYTAIRPKGHPVQPSTAEVVNDVKKAMKSYHCDYVFLATEDQDIVERFLQAFGRQLICLPQQRISGSHMNGDCYLAQEKEKQLSERNRHEDAMSYLAAIYLLTRCNCFIGGRTGGTKGVLLMADGFEYNKIYDLGLYP